jgi:hypothetical protein
MRRAAATDYDNVAIFLAIHGRLPPDYLEIFGIFRFSSR